MRILAAALALGWFTATAAGDVFVLKQGGQVEGELLNPDQRPRETYVIKTPAGATVTLAGVQVEEVLAVRPAEAEYERVRPRFADTVEGQWKLAEWCRQQGLSAQRRTHLERVVELDPNHVPARHALGYSQVNGRWTTQKQAMDEQGMIYYRGRYRTKQEIQILEERQKDDLQAKEWMQKIERWQGWLRGDKAPLAEEAINAINDPAAVPGLIQAMKSCPTPQVRILFLNALARINTTEAQKGLAFFAIEDPVEEIRLSCLDHLKKEKNPPAVDFFIGYLRSKNNQYVNRAGVALRAMNDPSAVGPLIEALVTTHKYKLRGPPPGQTSAGFGSGPGGAPGPMGLSTGGGGPKIITDVVQNRAVLEALMSLTGANYGFDVPGWKSWYAQQRKRTTIDARRGE